MKFLPKVKLSFYKSKRFFTFVLFICLRQSERLFILYVVFFLKINQK